MNNEITNLLKAAVECSIFINPTDPGLTYDEILEVGKRAGYQAGEIADAVMHSGQRQAGSAKFIPHHSTLAQWQFLFPEEPEYRNFDAFDFVVSELNARVKADGMRNAKVERSLVVERALAKGINRIDIEVAITCQILANQLSAKDGILSFPYNGQVRQLPSQTRDSTGRRQLLQRRDRARVYPFVKDIIARRTDGRPSSIESLDAFTEELDKLGYGMFRLWWTQTVAEFRHGDTHSSPVSVLVLAAALVEASLTFAVKHARQLGLPVFGSTDFNREPKTWKIDDLVASAARGGESSILDAPTKARVETLIRARQRIHAGRLLSDFLAGTPIPDLRPEEARDAKATAELVVRRVLDWLQKYPSA